MVEVVPMVERCLVRPFPRELLHLPDPVRVKRTVFADSVGLSPPPKKPA